MIKKLMFSALGVITIANVAYAIDCIYPTCDSWGYTMTASDCSGKEALKCPMDHNLQYCIEEPSSVACTPGIFYDNDKKECTTNHTSYVYLGDGYVTKIGQDGSFYSGAVSESSFGEPAKYCNSTVEGCTNDCVPLTNSDFNIVIPLIRTATVYMTGYQCFFVPHEMDVYEMYRYYDKPVNEYNEYGEMVYDFSECVNYNANNNEIAVGCKFKP